MPHLRQASHAQAIDRQLKAESSWRRKQALMALAVLLLLGAWAAVVFTSGAHHELRVGDHVSAKYPDGASYGATIAEIRGDGSAVVNWNDNDTEHRHVQRSDVEFEASKSGPLDEFAVMFEEFVQFVPMMKVLFALVVGFLWSWILKIRSDRHEKLTGSPLDVLWWQQHTTPMYLVLLVTLLCQLSTFRDELNSPANQQEIMFSVFANEISEISAEINRTCMRTFIANETLDADHSPWVAQVAYLTPIFATLTFLVNAVFTFKHVRRAKTVCLWNQGNRGATLWILQLPVVYSLTALYSVQTGLYGSRVGAFLCSEKVRLQEDGPAFFIEAGLSFGDGYEAIALLLFADITFNVIENVVDKVVLDAESVKKALGTMEKTVDGQLAVSDKDSVRSEFHAVAESNGQVMTRLEKMSEKLVHSTWSLSTLGIQYFAFSCFCTAIPQFLACQAFIWQWNDAYKFLSAFSDSWAGTFKGMGLLGSCVAIHNMVSIESEFDEVFLQGFDAKYKFVSVKIMVSIVFIQQMALPALFGLSLPRATLFDASLRIIEFTFISAFNILAWPLDQNFYGMQAIDIEGMEDMDEDLLADGKLGSLSEKFLHMETQKDLQALTGRTVSEDLRG